MQPATVWMVHKGTGRQGVRGELILDARHLVFRPDLAATRLESLGETVFPLEHIEKVSRAHATPVLEVRVSTPNVPRVVLFYFAKPPDIYSSPMANPRRAGATYLANSGLLYREEIDGWVGSIRDAAAPTWGST